MTKKQLDTLKSALYYWTQYTPYMTDEGFYDTIFEAWKGRNLDYNLLLTMLTNAGELPDWLNDIFCELLVNLNNDSLLNMLTLQEVYFSNLSIIDVAEEVGLDIYNVFPDIAYGLTWEDVVDESLKEDGLNSEYINIVGDMETIDLYKIYELNVYMNKLTEFDPLEITELGEFKEAIKEYIL